MAESISISADPNQPLLVFEELIPQLEALWMGEYDEIACMANTAAALHSVFGHHWTGFYRVVDNELVLGPFQGPIACTRIRQGKGVCGTAWQRKETIVVDDVDAFPGHIACSSLSKSEIVIPLSDTKGEVRAVLDIDAVEPARFTAIDKEQLEHICELLQRHIYS
jgi:L-methionine (R)-S-oxide reductase